MVEICRFEPDTVEIFHIGLSVSVEGHFTTAWVTFFPDWNFGSVVSNFSVVWNAYERACED
jgi:hypothetical protein